MLASHRIDPQKGWEEFHLLPAATDFVSTLAKVYNLPQLSVKKLPKFPPVEQLPSISDYIKNRYEDDPLAKSMLKKLQVSLDSLGYGELKSTYEIITEIKVLKEIMVSNPFAFKDEKSIKRSPAFAKLQNLISKTHAEKIETTKVVEATKVVAPASPKVETAFKGPSDDHKTLGDYAKQQESGVNAFEQELKKVIIQNNLGNVQITPNIRQVIDIARRLNLLEDKDVFKKFIGDIKAVDGVDQKQLLEKCHAVSENAKISVTPFSRSLAYITSVEIRLSSPNTGNEILLKELYNEVAKKFPDKVRFNPALMLIEFEPKDFLQLPQHALENAFRPFSKSYNQEVIDIAKKITAINPNISIHQKCVLNYKQLVNAGSIDKIEQQPLTSIQFSFKNEKEFKQFILRLAEVTRDKLSSPEVIYYSGKTRGESKPKLIVEVSATALDTCLKDPDKIKYLTSSDKKSFSDFKAVNQKLAAQGRKQEVQQPTAPKKSWW